MCKSLSVGLENDSEINYVDINFYNKADLEQFCDTLADYIMKKYEKMLLYRTINHNFCYLNASEKKEVYRKAKQLKSTKEIAQDFEVEQKRIIKEKLFEYIQQSNQMILDGFVTFRLKDYMQKLEDLVDSAVEEYMVQKEYNEFIELLRYFVDIQHPIYNIVHVMANADRTYTLTDNHYYDITKECISDFMKDVDAGELNYDDVLISSLISLAPRKIYMHNTQHINNKQFLETIKNVFGKRVIICEGCSMCDQCESKAPKEDTGVNLL